MQSGAPGPSFALPTAPPPYYAPTEAMDVALLGKAEPMAGADDQPPPPYDYGAQAAPPPHPVIVSQPQQVIVMQPALGPEPGNTLCTACQQFVTTRVSYESGGFAWLLCFGMCVLGLNLGCCLIPFCLRSCKDAVHYCPSCNAKLHHYKRL